MTSQLPPPYVAADALLPTVREHGYAVVPADGVAALAGCDRPALDALCPAWERLPPDAWLLDGGRYRRRRHASFLVEGDRLEQVPHRAHWQSRDYNALHGGMRRWFEPVEPETLGAPAWTGLLIGLGRLCSELRPARPWHVETHQFRIDTSDGIGRPTPEGAHRDGVDYVAVLVIGRHGIKGGETRVFEADGPNGQRFTLAEPWSLLFLDDARVIHESTPIQPLDGIGHRDTLVLTFRAGGFQGDEPAVPA